MRPKKWYIKVIALISPFVFLPGCLEFESIEQPSSILPGETFTVFIEVTVDSWGGGRSYFGVRLPVGWTIPGNAIPCTGAYTQTIHYDSSLSLEMESLSPSPQGYYWWVGTGDGTDLEGESVYAEVQIQTDGQTGRFYIDYMLSYTSGSPTDLTNQQRSDNHLIEVVDEYSPRELQAAVQGDTVSLSWDAPFVSEGLIGYNVYRDGQIINTDLVLDTVYVDENPAQELVCYTISSLYDNDDIHFMIYEIKVLVFSGGTGEPNDPYQIAAAVQLVSFSSADFPHLLDKCFVLVNDIDLDPNLPGGQVFERAVIAPDISELENGFQSTAFTGIFDGNGFKISNLTIAGHDYLGLIGTIHDGGQVWNLGVVEAYVHIVGAGSRIGILAGYNCGNVTNCYSTGSVSGWESVGGIVGDNDGKVTNCYSTSTVSGNPYVGGLVGENEGKVAYCYSTGSVSGWESVGGLLGVNDGDVSHSFWDMETSGQNQSDGGVGLTTAEMMDSEFISLNGWAGDPNWILDNVHDYPHLAWEGTPGQSIPEPIIDWMDGTGTTDNPYKVVNADQLVMISKAFILWDKHFVLSADISLIGKTWSMAVMPEFWGTFDGNGFVIGSLMIVGGNKLGLFGQLKEEARIMNMGIVDASVVSTGRYVGILAGYNCGNVTNCYSTGEVSGWESVGGLVGQNDSNVTNCHSTATVSGDWRIGGLVGFNWSGDITITTSYSTGTVSGERFVGGLVGWNYGGDVSNCYSTGEVSGERFVGGLVGKNDQSGSIATSYSTATVNGDQRIGGLVGDNNGDVSNCYSIGLVSGERGPVGGLVGNNGYEPGLVINSFWDIWASGQATSDGGVGKTTAQMQMASTFVGWGCDPVWTLNEGLDYPRLFWENLPGELMTEPSYGGGSGTQDNPYLIYTAEQLNMIGRSLCDWDKHFKLMADIDLVGYEGDQFNVIGIGRNWAFTGVFDGNGHTISNFSYMSTDTDCIGLFGYVDDPNAEVKNLGLLDPEINAGTGDHVGSLVGRLGNGTVTGCYARGGTISGRNDVGGLAGTNYGTVTNCSSSASVSGTDLRVGGIVGRNHRSSITTSYSTGTVSGGGSVGGLVGSNYEGSITSSFWDMETSGLLTSDGGIGKTTAKMQTASTFLNVGWDFVGETANGTDDIWWILDGQDYPRLWWELSD